MTRNKYFTGISRNQSNNDFIDQHRQIKKELTEYVEFIKEIKDKWRDRKKDEFINKHIEQSIKYAHDYLKQCEILIVQLELARKIKEN
jgi:hypothetical protein